MATTADSICDIPQGGVNYVSKTMRITVVLVTAVALSLVFATSALAYSGYEQPCAPCHTSTAITITATPVSNDGVTAVYTIAAPGASEYAVFAGRTKILAGSTLPANISVPAGAPYQIYAINGDLASGTAGELTISPASSAIDAIDYSGDDTAPTSTSNAAASYTNKAVITINATDDSTYGVAYIYYSINGGAARTTPVGTSGYATAVIRRTTPGTGTYTLEFWAQDRNGNIEDPQNEATFTITNSTPEYEGAWPQTTLGTNGTSQWTYQDAYDENPKRQGGYAAYGGNSGYYANPHGGYDTSTGKCKVCHAVHRAEGSYYLLRAENSDDACNYCHIGGSAHSDAEVYTGNDAGIYTPNGHTIGASTNIPDSSIMQTSTVVDVNGEDVKVRTYDTTEKKLYRVVWYHRDGDDASGAGHPVYGSQTTPQFSRVGPTPLMCSSCHQVHNASRMIWQPQEYGSGYNSPVDDDRLTAGYKLLRKFPGATSVLSTPAVLLGTTAIAKVPESTLVADVTYSHDQSMETTYVDTDVSGRGDGYTWRQTDWIAGEWHGYENNAVQYGFSIWCADCHNLNIGTPGHVAGTAEIGYSEIHAERTHPVPAARGFQCYSCHRTGLDTHETTAAQTSGCNRCHYNLENYPIQNDAAANWLGQPSDFPHAGSDDEIKLLGAFSLSELPAQNGTFTYNWKATDITADNLDAVCLRCHTDNGVHY